MVAGLFDLFEQGGHLGSPVAVMGQAAAVKGNRLRSIGKQSGQGLTCGRNGGIASTHMGRKSIDHEPLVGTARNNPLAPQILPEEEIENQSHDRSEISTTTHGIVLSGLRLPKMTTRMMPITVAV